MRLGFLATLPLLVSLGAAAADTAPAPAAPASGARTYGKPLTGLKPVPLADVLATPTSGQVVAIEGEVAKVCLRKGCWLELRQGDSTVHVSFEGYSFFVPTDSGGRRVALEGKVQVSEPDPAAVEHLQGEGAGEAAARRVSIVATGVELRDAVPAAAGDQDAGAGAAGGRTKE